MGLSETQGLLARLYVETPLRERFFADPMPSEDGIEHVTRLVRDTRLARIIHLVETAQGSRAPVQAFVDRFVKQVEGLVTGDPMDPATDVGPVIDAGALDRIAAWVDEAVAGGAGVLVTIEETNLPVQRIESASELDLSQVSHDQLGLLEAELQRRDMEVAN